MPLISNLTLIFEEIKNEKIVVSESPIGMVSSVPFIARNQSGEQSSITFRAILAQEPYLGDYGNYSKLKESVFQTDRLEHARILIVLAKSGYSTEEWQVILDYISQVNSRYCFS